MSLIGMLEQIDVKSVLRRVEAYSKTGLFVVKRGAQWVEIYFRDGRLMCVGPAHMQVGLGERLFQTGVISAQAWQEVLRSVGNAQPSEMRMALTLMDLGYVGHDEMRVWAAERANEVLTTLFSWPAGEMYFEDNIAPPADRLLVALSISALLTKLSEASNAAVPTTTSAVPSSPTTKTAPVLQEHSKSSIPVVHVSNAPTLMESSQFFSKQVQGTARIASPDEVMASLGIVSKGSEMPPAAVVTSSLASGPLHHAPSALRLISDAPEGEPTQLIPSAPLPPTPIVAPKRVDTSFMQPDMLLVPADLSAAREQSSQVQLTPEQWRLLTLVDGQTTLQVACQTLLMPPDVLCQIAGELIALGLIRVLSPFAYHNEGNKMLPHVQEAAKAAATSNYVTVSSGSVAVGLSPMLPSSDVLPQYSPVLPFETQSQWGNGGNGATFVPGRGWVTPPQLLQPLQPSGPLAMGNTFDYARSGK